MFLLLSLACTPTAPAELLLSGAPIHLSTTETTDALAVRDGVVVGVGDDAREMVDDATQRVTLDGGSAWPGFQDAHVHLLAGSFVLDRLLVVGTGSMRQLVDRTADYAARAPDEPWIVGYGWMAELVEDPSGVALDAAVPDRPVLLVDNSGHAALVNSVAMQRAGIDRNTPDPPDGTIVRDEEGNPTGYLTEGALALVSDAALADYDDATLASGLLDAILSFTDGGITGVAEILASPGFDLTRPWVYSDLEASGALELRVHVYVPLFHVEDFAQAAAWGEQINGELVRFAGVKLWVDGSMGTGDSWVSEPLTDDPEDFGSWYFTAQQLEQVIDQAEQAGVSVKLHANGDAAVAAALDAFEAVASRGGLTQPHTLDHVVLISEADRARLRALGVTASVQPAHFLGARLSDTAELWGEERFAHAYDARALADAEVPLALGTDWPVWPSPSAPAQLWAATTLADGRALTLDEALTAYTAGSARAVGREGLLGCLHVGCAADIVVMDEELRGLTPEQLSDVRVRDVWVAGRKLR